jgi:hypothetical protein
MSLKYIFSPLDINNNPNKHTTQQPDTMANKWMIHFGKFRKAHPDMPVTKAAKEAAKTYKKQAGGSAMGGDLSPESVHGMHGSGVDLDTQVATQYSGGKKSRRSKSGKKSRKSGKKSRRSRSCKRR